MKLSDVSAVLSQEIYKQNPTSLRVQGVRWNFIPSLSRLPIVGVWKNDSMKSIFIVVRGTASVGDAIQDVHILMNNPQATLHFKEAEKVLKNVKQIYPEYKILASGHSLGSSTAVALGKKYNDIQVYGFNTGVSPKAIPSMLKDRLACSVFRWKCRDNITEYTTRNGADPISFLSRLSKNTKTRKRKGDGNIHSVSNFTTGIEKEEIKETEQAQNKPLDPADPVEQTEQPTEQQTEPVDLQQGGRVMLPKHHNVTKMADNYMSGMYDRLHRNPIILK